MLTKPRWLLHLKGACMFVLAILLYRAGHFSWGLCALLFLAPDLFMLGYLIDAAWGAASYMLGFGLKYPTFFKDTHLEHV